MAEVTIPLNSGAFANVDAIELSDPQYAILQKNLLHTDMGAIIDRPGLDEFCEAGNYSPIGMTFFSDKVVAVSSTRKIYSITSAGVVTEITGATDLEGSDRPVFATDGTYLAIAGGGQIKRWSGTGDCDDMPGNPEDTKQIVFLDGYWVLVSEDETELRLAGPTAATRLTWDSSDFFSAEGLPDTIKTISVLQKELYVWGKDSTEVFQNFGDSITPFKPTFFIDKGTNSPHSIIKADNTFWYLDKDRRFVGLQGRTPVVISTPYEREIQQFATITDCIGYKIDIRGSYLLLWQFPTENRTFVYDYRLKHWGEWSGFDTSDMRFNLNSYVYADGWAKHLVGDLRTGQIYTLSFDHKSDAENVRRCIRRSGYIDHGTSARKRNLFYRLTVKRGVGDVSGEEPQLLMRFRDDGQGWSDFESIGLGLSGDFEPVAYLRNTGMYRKRQIEFLLTDPVELSLLKLEESVEVMSH